MRRSWTFGRKLGAGLGSLALLAVVGGSVGVVALQSVVRSKDALITEYAHILTQAGELQSLTEERVSGDRAYLLSREEKYLTDLQRARQAFEKGLADLLRASADPEARRLIEAISRAQAEHKAVADRVLDLRRKDAPLASVIGLFDTELEPRTDTLRKSIDDFVRYEQGRVKEAQAESSRTASFASGVLVVAMVAIGLGSVLVAVVLARALSSQLGSAVAQTQSSALQLQGSANQQATGAREQSTALSEITTTIRELLATSRQIAESAQHVSRIADESAAAARGGEGTVGRAHESIASIRKQVDLVVAHMLDLGKKSHQIGSVLEIVSELAEQTNILAINATIEAAGAGEAGRRFAVVADEIRKLADRVGGSTKEIRGLIEDVRNSVNTTVMATEGGSKSVDAGTRQFGEVAAAFGQIAGLVGTANQAAKEIELSTKQQATAIAQVDIAISNVAQAAREAEATTGQVLETASALATLSRRLGAVIRPEDSAA